MRVQDYPDAYGSVQNALAQSVLCLEIFQPFFGNDQYVFDKPESACEYCSRRDKSRKGLSRIPIFEKTGGFLGQAFGQILVFLFSSTSSWIMSRERSIHPVDFRGGARQY